MNRGLRFSAWLGAMVVSSALLPACSCSCGVATDSGTVDGDGGWGGGGQGGDAHGGGGHGGDAHGGGGGQGGDGHGGGAPTPRRVGATETVTAGEVARSSRYRMVFTLGQPTQNQGTSTSPKVRMRGGLIGADGSLP
ncbi:hypothetical protein WME73_14240 [Sorangium sp. So ce302]|uniref:hypothetical protein n=1 Tax=unclassified Sorangium TaxID=2621164 RepID=UPI003F619BF2